MTSAEASGAERRGALDGYLRSLRGGGNAIGLLAVLVVICVALSVISPFFLTANNLLNIGRAISIVGIVAVGETIVIIAGGFDLSVGSVMAAAGMTAGYLLNSGVDLWAAALAAIGVGLVIGLANGLIISRARINPLIATLATLAIVRGLAYVISGGQEIVMDDEALLGLGTGTLAGIPYIVLILLATFVVFGWAMPRTLFGRYAYAIGSSARAAARAGVSVARWRTSYYVTCAGLAALAGIVFIARTGNAQPSAALGIELDVITAVILGGTSLSGGRGRLFGTFLGLLLLGVVNNGLVLIGVPAFWQQVVKGSILLLAVLYDELQRRHLEEA